MPEYVFSLPLKCAGRLDGMNFTFNVLRVAKLATAIIVYYRSFSEEAALHSQGQLPQRDRRRDVASGAKT